ncbi:transmembrane protein 94-like [Brienomyrus brachyistius]|uniref:transmembrane protein 94-like n=1 Tax=Brienomyrus brachyistius TaxID=42636 RepID=UPI0020B2656E|nr:transmembrane protein 94-like [Brienomyrus brachyistius]
MRDRTTLAGGCALLLPLVVGGGSHGCGVRRCPAGCRPCYITWKLQKCCDVCSPAALEGYADLFAQPSPAVPLQWTYRDGRLVNLPVSLLVEGDIIALRPGAAAPAELRGVQEAEHVMLSRNDVFSRLSAPPCPPGSSRPRPRNLLRPQLFRVIRTPAVDSIQRCLELGQRRPVTVLDNERYASPAGEGRGATCAGGAAGAELSSVFFQCPRCGTVACHSSAVTGDEDEEEPSGPGNPLLPLKDHIFLGLVSSQYQARPDMVRLISSCERACIRFVYFSKEEEVRSKVFAERMGLETGWNCHISLQSDCFPQDTESLEDPGREECGEQGCGDSLLDEDVRQVDREAGRALDSEGACLITDLNRAKLPKGMQNIRPHLENVDNVPLLVPLFTDCTRQTMCEMVQVMQEYGEVVCCLGSSQNINNNAVFLQSDVSIALEPLLPSSYWTAAGPPATQLPCGHLAHSSPAQLSSALCGLPCTIHLGPQENTTIIRLIKQSRHMTAGIRKCFLLLLQCQLSLVLLQILACACQLPPPLSTSDVLALSCLYSPLISISLICRPTDGSIMKVPTGKNALFLPKKTQRFFMLYFLVKFGPTVSVCLTCFGLMLHGFCLRINVADPLRCHLAAVLTNSTDSFPDWFGEQSDGLTLAQNITAFFVLLYAMSTSVSHVHHCAPVWKKSPFNNSYWCAALTVVSVIHVSAAVGFHVLGRDLTAHERRLEGLMASGSTLATPSDLHQRGSQASRDQNESEISGTTEAAV